MIAVTGGSGFLGRHVLDFLRKNKIEHRSLLRPEVNFKDLSSLEKALQGADQLLHMAAALNGSTDDLYEGNHLLIKRVVEAAQRAGVKKIIYVSSAAAYLKKGPYGQSKWRAEEILKSSGIPYLIFRPTLIYGPGDTKNVGMMERLVQRLPLLPLLGGGQFLIQPVYVKDLVEALVKALDSPVTNKTYYLSGPSQISLKDMLHIIAESLGKKVVLIPVPLKPVQACVRLYSTVFPRTRLPVKQILELDQHSAFDIQDAKNDFGFTPRNFKDGVRAMRRGESICAA